MNDDQPFDISILRKAGLTESQAKGYIALIEQGSLSPAELAEKTGETRTNGYMICEKLEKLGLATKKDGKKALYTPNHPSALEALAERRRKILMRNEQEVKSGLKELIDLYYNTTEMPGARYIEGKEGQLKIYADILSQNKPLYLVRTPKERKFFGKQPIKDFIAARKRQKLPVVGLTPFMKDSNTNPNKDRDNLLDRQFMPYECYDAPVEIDIYGDRVSFISYGETLTGVTIDNRYIAEAMRQLFLMARMGAAVEFQKHPDLVKRLERERKQHSRAPRYTEPPDDTSEQSP